MAIGPTPHYAPLDWHPIVYGPIIYGPNETEIRQELKPSQLLMPRQQRIYESRKRWAGYKK